MIPKIIWQTHEAEYEDLLPFQKNITNTWKNLNPGWEYHYVDAKQRKENVKKYDKDLYELYCSLNNIQQSDIWRLVIIYVNGGFYADMDSVCCYTIEDMLKEKYKDKDMVCSDKNFQTSGPNPINNSNFGGIKNSFIVKKTIDRIIKQYKEYKVENIETFENLFPILNFSYFVLENSKNVLFDINYFYHSKDFKDSFRTDLETTFNKRTDTYLNIAKENNWIIY
jgi:mannosyltransferase OCH1-like enzyme